jgi:two-component system, LuxR family, sensor kinase FixL
MLGTRFTKPIARITASVRAFREGDTGPLDLPVDLNDEIGETARAFSELLKKLDAHRAKLSIQLEAFIANSVDGFVVINDRGLIEQANPALLELFGYKRDELIGRNVAVLMPETTGGKHDGYLNAYRETGNRTYIGTIRDEEARRKDGTTFPIALSISEVQLADRRILSAVIRDMTATREAQRKIESYTAELERSNQELDQFAYVASHDLKAPLRVIDNASRWLEEDLGEKLTDDDRENMALLRNRVRRMEKLLDDLLDYSRIGRAVDDRYKEVVSGAKLIEDILMLLAPPPSMTVQVSSSFESITVNRMPLQQVLYNLINNAIKHHDLESGNIELAVIEAGEWLHFSVCDDGPGIPAEFQEKVFEMFHTLKPRDQVEGSGMGLALAKKTVEYFGGTIALTSGQGQGAEFAFTWPKQRRQKRQSSKAA